MKLIVRGIINKSTKITNTDDKSIKIGMNSSGVCTLVKIWNGNIILLRKI